MAIPVALLVTAAEAVRNPAVQDTAKTIFGWLRDRRGGSEAVGAAKPDMDTLLNDLPTRAELALALSQIDVRIARAEQRCIHFIGGGLVAATAILATLILLF